MTKDEALKLALDALETSMYPQQKQLQAITAIKEALAQPNPWEKFCDSNCVWTDHHPDCKLAQRTWVGLTDEEIMDNWLKVMWAVGDKNKLPIPEFARAIEAKLKEKNT